MLVNSIRQIASIHDFASDKRCIVFSGIEGLLFSSMSIAGILLDRHGYICFDFRALLAFLVLCPASCLLCFVANRYLAMRKPTGAKKTVAKENESKILALSIILLIACTVVWYLVLFPGIYWYDAPKWLHEWGNPSTPITSQYSIPYTWLFFSFATFGNEHLGSYESGLALFSFLQAAIVLYVEIRIVLFVYSRFNHRLACLIPSLFYGLHPLLAIMAFSTAQDTPFMAMLGIIGVYLYDMNTKPEPFWATKRKPFLYALAILLFCFSRNNGLYAIALVVLFSVVYVPKHRIKLALTTCLPLLLFVLYQGPLLNAVGVDTSSTIREMSSIPVQQIARTYVYDSDTLTNDESETIEAYIPKDVLKTYETFPSISDSLKSNLDVEKFQSDPLASFMFYIKLGIKHPKAYTEAALMSNLGLWCPGKQYPDPRIYHPWIECVCATPNAYYPNAGLIDMQSQSLIPAAHSVISYLFGWDRQHFAQIPLIGSLCRSATYFWLLVFAFGYMLYSRQHQRLVFLAPFLGVVITILLAPVVIFRYVAPLVFAAPLLVAMLLETPKRVSD